MSFANIPEELKQLNQWVVWRYEDTGSKPTKVPYDAKTGNLASVIDSSSWCDFSTALSRSKDYSGIGFVFTNADNYSFIDLDDVAGDQVALNRQIEIYREFDSYSEISPSGNGLHIIVKGKAPAGRRRSHIEVYSSHRYATFTGNVYNDKPIRDCQDKLMQLWHQMGGGPATHIYGGDQEEKENDATIIEKASGATNGAKFLSLFNGQWQDLYASQSEADFSFIDIVAFYTQSRNQIQRIFHSSALGKRDKARRVDYITWMINKSFDRMLPPIDFDGFRNQLELTLVGADKTTASLEPELPGIPAAPIDQPAVSSTIPIPPGLLGELAQFIYAAAPRPVPEIALAGAIGLMAGIAGRSYNVRGTGLNMYVLTLAKTGRGKDAIHSGVDKLMNAVSSITPHNIGVPTASRFRGPGIINSGQALVKHLSNVSNSFASFLGEFGITISRISSPYANSADKMLYQMLLDLYSKSGNGQTLQPSIYSKREENTALVHSPALTIVGESNPKIFYDMLNEDMISFGLLPRFLIINYTGERVPENDDHYKVQPGMTLIEKLSTFIANSETRIHHNQVIDIQLDNEAKKVLKDFNSYADFKINSSTDQIIEELWNRAAMKTQRLAALIAVGCNYIAPTVTRDNLDWAMNIVQADIKLLTSKFEKGEVGVNTNELRQLSELARIAKEFVTKDWIVIKAYIDNYKLHEQKVIPYAFLNKRLANNVAFKSDRLGATNALKRTIQTLLDADKLREVPRTKVSEEFGTTQRCFVISNLDLIKDIS